jgi:pimeloyl-ACP methyl ester carboxylesterase
LSGTTGKPPIVLVHGAWHGAWCWKRVMPRLRAAGHEVFAPTLTGCGDRAHLAAPTVSLDTHVADVLGLLEVEELSDVVLVGHSYAGMVITGVADRAGGRLHSLVYLDAFVPESGRSLMDYLPAERRAASIEAGERSGFLEPPDAKYFGVNDPADYAWVMRRMTRQPCATMSQPLHLTGDSGAKLPRTYVYCSSPATGTFDQFAARLRSEPRWRFHELAAGHLCMVTAPEALVKILLEST